MIDIEIRTKDKTIQERINDWKELKDLLLRYEDYVSFSASNNNERSNNEERHTR